MRLFLLAACLACMDIEKASVVASAATTEPLKYYHKNLGIPEAARIAKAEKETPVDPEAPVGAYPYFIGLVITLTSDATSVCGSSMLTNTKSVTAAHCWWDGHEQASQFELVFGSARLFSGGQRVVSTNVEMHVHWDPNNLVNNIAIITFDEVADSDVIQPVPLPSGKLLNHDFAGNWAQAVGFGTKKDSDSELSSVNLQVITNAVCKKSFGSSYVFASTLCTSGNGGVDACVADSGGPLTIISEEQPVLIGVTSYSAALGCQRELPTAFTRITSFITWIQDRILLTD